MLYYKYCSTFDSTPQGNIGPVLDNLLELLELPYTILCPALPVNGRIVRDGRLYVNGVLLEQSPMRHHPLNPMRHSSIPVLMGEQSRYPCYVLDREALQKDTKDIFALVEEWKRNNPHFYICVDYCDEEDGCKIAELFGELKLISGGSALAAHLGMAKKKTDSEDVNRRTGSGRVLILSGSCSQTTCAQVAAFLDGGGKGVRIDPIQLLNESQTLENIWEFVELNSDRDVLIYSSQLPEERSTTAAHNQNRISFVLEAIMAKLAQRAVERGIKNLIIAGGETSGAVMQALGWNCFSVGDSVAPGVPMLFPLEKTRMCLILKSGNFGPVNFFNWATDTMRMY